MASEICSISDPRARGALIEKFVEVAKVCVHMHWLYYVTVNCEYREVENNYNIEILNY